MKKIISIIGLITLMSFSYSQVVFESNFSTWRGGDPSDWMGSSSTITTSGVWQQLIGANYGIYLCGLQNSSATAGLGMATHTIPVVRGSKFELKIYVKSITGEMALGYYDVSNGVYGTVSAYSSVSSTSFITVIDSLTIPATCDSVQFIVYARNTRPFGTGSQGVSMDSVVIINKWSPAPPPPPAPSYLKKSIYDIQYTTATSGDSPYADSLVETSGVITAVRSNGYWIQDSASTWNGIYVFDNVNSPSRGDNITIKAKVNEFYNLTQLKDVDTLIINSTGNTLPTPISINTTELSTQESNEGVLCKVTGATCINPSAGNGEWYIINTSDTGVVDDMLYSYTPTMGYKYDVTGVIQYSFGEYKIEPRDTNDIAQFSTISLVENELKFSIFPNPVNAKLTLTGENIEKAEIYSANGKLIKTVSFTLNKIIDVSDLEKGIYVIKVSNNNKTGISRFIKQ